MRVATAYPASAAATASVSASRIRGYLGERPGYLGADDGNILQRKVFRCLHRLIRLIHRKPVHREEGVDIGARVAEV